MNQDQLNTLCTAYQNVDKMSLHTGDPGNLGANDSALDHASLSWSDPVNGVMSATGEFEDVPAGTYTHAGLWDDTVFVEAVALNLVVAGTIPVSVTVEHHAKERL